MYGRVLSRRIKQLLLIEVTEGLAYFVALWLGKRAWPFVFGLTATKSRNLWFTRIWQLLTVYDMSSKSMTEKGPGPRILLAPRENSRAWPFSVGCHSQVDIFMLMYEMVRIC